MLTKNAAKSDVQQFLQLSKMIIDDGHRENVDAVLVVSRKANGELFEEDKTLSEELRELFSNLFEEAKTEGKNEGLEKGLEKGRNETKKEDALAMLKEKLAVTLVAKCTGLPLTEVQALAATL